MTLSLSCRWPDFLSCFFPSVFFQLPPSLSLARSLAFSLSLFSLSTGLFSIHFFLSKLYTSLSPSPPVKAARNAPFAARSQHHPSLRPAAEACRPAAEEPASARPAAASAPVSAASGGRGPVHFSAKPSENLCIFIIYQKPLHRVITLKPLAGRDARD